MPGTHPVGSDGPLMGAALGSASLALETLCASFLVNATHFFEAAQPQLTWVWESLTTLALTTPLLGSHGKTAEINALLLQAAGVALRMPKLRTLEIWTGKAGGASAFWYHNTAANSASIGQRGTWVPALEERTVAAWNEVARRHTGRDIVVEPTPSLLDAGVIRSHGDAVYHLGLKAPVLHPVSLCQMREERS